MGPGRYSSRNAVSFPNASICGGCMLVATMLSTTMRKSAAGMSATSEMRRGLPSRVTQPPIRKAQKATSRSASAARRTERQKQKAPKHMIWSEIEVARQALPARIISLAIDNQRRLWGAPIISRQIRRGNCGLGPARAA